MSFKPLSEQHFGFLSLKGVCAGSSESIHFKMPHSWKSQVAAFMSGFYPGSLFGTKPNGVMC